MKKQVKLFVVIFIVTIFYFLLPLSVNAKMSQPTVLILYSLKNEEQLKEVRILET